MAKEFDVTVKYWKAGQGFTHSEVFEQVEEGYNFDDIVEWYRSEWADDGYDAIELSVVDEDGHELDTEWIEFNKLKEE